MIHSNFRGHKIFYDGKTWRYVDTKATIDTEAERPCGRCGCFPTEEGHDSCLGTLKGVTNACCGHGNLDDAYIQFEDGSIISGSDTTKKERENDD